MAKTGVENLEDLRGLGLGTDGRAELIQTQSECTFVFTNEDGWASGVVMTYIQLDGSFWVTAVEGRGHVRGVEKDPRVSMVISNAGTGLPGRRMLSMRGTAIIHRDAATKERFLAAFAARHQPEDPESFVRLLDSANRVVIQFHPTAVAVSHDSTRMPGNGRGGSSVPA
ncbi:pyridoxamine 5'-phosphate oxidase family protein [Arthrobacter sp. GCM10027362]|jgi:general stress protein 26|uniref:pyridoxamine 5'-phosphate oxidase family protein n=1 Tax=Arthrobacter sp. GCM10027362 TaxID=3273379 RepID=UPI00363B50AA